MKDYKKDFPLFDHYNGIYLDSAATAQRPAVVLEAITRFYQEENANPLRGLYDLSTLATERYASARKTVQHFIGADKSHEIIFTRNTTESLNLVAYSYGLSRLKPGDEILVSIAEHHSNLLPWRMVARKTGATIRYLECNADGSWPQDYFEKMITDKTALIAIAHVSNVFGRTNPIEKIARLAHEKGAVIVVDAAQSVPHQKIDVKALDVDFLAFSGHKLGGPMGIGVLYGKEEHLQEMPPFLRGGEMIEYVTRDSQTWAELPHKFEAGTVNASDAAGLEAAIHYLTSIGFDAVSTHEKELTDYAMEGMRDIYGLKLIGSDRAEEHSGILTFTLDGVHPHDIASILDADGIAIRAGHHCAGPLMQYMGVMSTARASLYLYNDKKDIERFIKSLSEIRRKMGYDK